MPNRHEHLFGDIVFREGDRVMQTRGGENREVRRLKRAVPAVLTLMLTIAAVAWFTSRPYDDSIQAPVLMRRFQGDLEIVTGDERVELGTDVGELKGETVAFTHYALEGWRVSNLYSVTRPEHWERVRRPRDLGEPVAKINLAELLNVTIYDSGCAMAHYGYSTPKYRDTAYYRITDAAPEEIVRYIEETGVPELFHVETFY